MFLLRIHYLYCANDYMYKQRPMIKKLSGIYGTNGKKCALHIFFVLSVVITTLFIFCFRLIFSELLKIRDRLCLPSTRSYSHKIKKKKKKRNSLVVFPEYVGSVVLNSGKCLLFVFGNRCLLLKFVFKIFKQQKIKIKS